MNIRQASQRPEEQVDAFALLERADTGYQPDGTVQLQLAPNPCCGTHRGRHRIEDDAQALWWKPGRGFHPGCSDVTRVDDQYIHEVLECLAQSPSRSLSGRPGAYDAKSNDHTFGVRAARGP